MPRLLLVLVTLVLVGLLMPVARACSCGGENPRDALARTDAAIVGVVLSHTEVGRRGVDQEDWHVRVEESFKGKLRGEIVVRSDGPDEHTCGLRLDVGQRIGLFISGIDGRFYSSNCEKVAADVMRRASEPLAPPNGEGPPMFLARTRGEHELATLDARGRVLLYAGSAYEPRFDVCLGGSWAAEIDIGWDERRFKPYVAVGRRELVSMKLRDAHRLARFETSVRSDELYVDDVRCRDPEAKDIYVLGQRQESIGPAILLRIQDGRADVVLEDEPVTSIEFAPTRAVAYLAMGDRDIGYALEELDLITRERRRLTAMRGPVSGLVVDPTGTKLAGAENSESGPKVSLFTFDLATEEIKRSRQPRTVPVWVGDGLAAPHHTGQGLRVYDVQMRLIASKPDWKGPAVAVGERIYGAWGGKLHSTAPGDGPIRVVSDVGLTLEPLDAAPVISLERRPRLTWTVLGLLAFLLAFATILVRSRRRSSSEPPGDPAALS